MSEDGIYQALYRVYDNINSEINYRVWADFIEENFRRHNIPAGASVVDLGCGTGSMTLELAVRGYDMTGIDKSVEMLSVACERLNEAGISGVLLLEQDIRSFELYGTVDAVVCCLDTLNHLTGTGELERVFSLVYNYLNPNGLFIFDVNSKYKFEQIYGDKDYILEDDSTLVCWRNIYNKKTKLCTFYISAFEENPDGTYKRFDGVQKERCYSRFYLEKMLDKCGFQLVCVTGGYNFEKVDNKTDRWYFISKPIK